VLDQSPSLESLSEDLLHALALDKPLEIGEYQITSPCDTAYNCFSWSACYNDVRLDPTDDSSPWYQGENADNDEATMLRLFESEHFQKCEDYPEPKEGEQIIVLYENEDKKITHAIRLLPEVNLWVSKLGDEEDVIQLTPDSFFGELYGRKLIFMKRKWDKPLPEAPKVAISPPEYCEAY
jgi:hypothetical protein